MKTWRFPNVIVHYKGVSGNLLIENQAHQNWLPTPLKQPNRIQRELDVESDVETPSKYSEQAAIERERAARPEA
ncbi:unnamed protein product [Orchesella dallaii]|uniref:Uncharacterized protein n=1 Tax=Orchesella dallaii TaxID=48710 RepID=A0ABP1S0U1_9HEXA